MTVKHLIARENQRPNELIARTLDVSAVGSGPTSPTLKVYEITSTAAVDVTSAVASGTPSVSGNIITTQKVGTLTDGKMYQVELKFTLSGNVLEYYWILDCTDERSST